MYGFFLDAGGLIPTFEAHTLRIVVQKLSLLPVFGSPMLRQGIYRVCIFLADAMTKIIAGDLTNPRDDRL